MATHMAAARAAGNGNGAGRGGDAGSVDPLHRMEETRAALRTAAGANEGDPFPRSTVLQVALSPGFRWITAVVVGAAALAVWRRLPARRTGLLLGALSLARRLREPR